MTINLNEVFFVMSKEKEGMNNPKKYEIKNIFDFNYLDPFFLVYSAPINTSNIILRDDIELEGIYPPIETDLVIKVAFKKLDKKFVYQSFYPYSMQQAKYLFDIGVDISFLTEIYDFNKNDIINGYVIKEGLKEKFYPLSMENNKRGYYYFNESITGKPEFIDLSFFSLFMK